MSLLDEGRQFLEQARSRNASAQAEVFLVESESRTSEWSEGQPENLVAARGRGAGVRWLEGNKLGFAHTNRLESEGFTACLAQAQASARLTPEDPFVGFSSVATPSVSGLDLEDPQLSGAAFDAHAAFLETLESTVRKRDPRFTKVLRASYTESRSTIALANSHGVVSTYGGTHASFSLACVAVQDGETQIGYGFHAARHLSDLQRDHVLQRTMEGTLALLGGKQIPSGRYDLILDPLVAAEMLGLFADALRGDQVLKGKSFLGDKLGQSIGATGVRIVDDGSRARALGSSPFDAEGGPTQRTELVRDGVLQNFMYDRYTARKAGKSSTGNAGRGSHKSLPEPEPTNFYLEPGVSSADSMIAGVESGLYIRNVMGLHTVDTISGDFSLGIMGERIEHGKRTHGVRGVTIAGNLLDLLKNVQAVGSDLIFFGSVGSPTLWIKNISVGGL